MRSRLGRETKHKLGVNSPAVILDSYLTISIIFKDVIDPVGDSFPGDTMCFHCGVIVHP